MKKGKILFIDTETGGVNPLKHKLLTIGMVLWEDGKLKDKLEVALKDTLYAVTPEALQINQIDLETHVHNALENLPAIEQIIDFVEKHFSGQKATIAGHNVHFDVGFLKRLFEEEGIQYNQYFSHRLIDTASILNYLYFSGVLPDQLSSSDAAFKYFSISPVGRHTSLGDAVATAQLFNKLISFERKLRTRNLRIKPTGYPGKIGKSANKRSASNKAKLVQARP